MDYRNTSASQWYESMVSDMNGFPFAFRYAGIEYSGFGGLEALGSERREIEGRIENEFTYGLNDLRVKVLFCHYPSFGVSEWTVRFTNVSAGDSGILEDAWTTLELEGDSPVLRGILGDHVNQYRPYEKDLQEKPVSFISDSGRPTHVNFPYFDVSHGSGGTMLAIGWAGTWTAEFSYSDGKTKCSARSVNGMRTVLRAGESIRTALFVYAPYQVRDEWYATNFWRAWFVECNLPRNDASGKKVQPFSACCIANDTGLPNSDGSISERHTTWRPSLEKMIEVGAKVDVRWFDAGWYVAPDGSSPESDWWGTVGTWVLDPVKWPGKTFLESTEFARENGMRTLMWFEPERVTDVENLVTNFDYKPEWAIQRPGVHSISNNIGIPECYEWTVSRICKLLKENKVEIYREDNNRDPGSLWRYLDSQESGIRTGITECKFVEAHYRMWDEIIDCTLSFGGAGFVDSCASGGGRNDLESLRRGIPLLRSDSDRSSTSLRLSMTTSFNRWVPFCGANTKEKAYELDPTGRTDVYTWRASYLPALNVDSQFTQDPDQDFDMLRFGLNEWKQVRPFLLKDFHVLTDWHDKNNKTGFTAYCFSDPVQRRGVLFLFRMEDCEQNEIQLKLPFDADKITLKDQDSGQVTEVAGKETASFLLDEKRQAKLLWISW